MVHSIMKFDYGVVTPFPNNEKRKQGGAARFIKQIVQHFEGIRGKIYSEQLPDERIEVLDHYEVVPSWKKSGFAPFKEVIEDIDREKISKLLVNFEFGAYGGIVGIIWLLFFYLGLRIKRVRIVTIFHPAVLTYAEMVGIADHLGKNKHSLSLFIFAVGMRFYALLLSLLSSKIVTFEEEFGQRLERLGVPKKKISVIPHQIYGKASQSTFPKGKLSLLFFGFLVPYKGLDLLLDAYGCVDKQKISLTVVGGKSPNAMNDSYYDYITKRMAHEEVDYVDYVPDDEIPKYFRNAHLLILPYKNLMASSGPLAWAIGEGRPFLMSSNLKAYLQNVDFIEAMKFNKVSSNDILFEFDSNSLAKKLDFYADNREKLEALQDVSFKLQVFRSPELTARRYKQLLFS